MTSEKQVDDDNETATSSAEKTDDQDEAKSKSSHSDDDDDTSSNASSEYEVERILSKRRRRRGGYEYYIKWVGYDHSANEWIPATSLSCPERLAEFEREETRKQQGLKKGKIQSQKRRKHKANTNNHRRKKRRVKMIIDDDEEEPVRSVQSSHSSSTKSDKDLLIYGVEKGYKVQAILGINRTKGDQLHYLVHYKSPTIFEDNMELIPADIAKKFCEDELIQFYETRIAWNDRHID